MRKQILRDLFSGQICPWEKTPDPNSARSQQSSLLTIKATALRKTLTDEQLAAFNDYAAEHHYYTHLTEEDGFVEGFCLAVKVLIAALDLPDDIVKVPQEVNVNADR